MSEIEKKIIAIAIVILAIIGVIVLIAIALIAGIGGFGTQFKIVSHNGEIRVESVYPEIRYNYTVYAKIRHNTGSQDSITITVELTRKDLSTITKEQTVTIPVGQEKILTFFFSNDDLKGEIPIQYKIYGG